MPRGVKGPRYYWTYDPDHVFRGPLYLTDAEARRAMDLGWHLQLVSGTGKVSA